jgi:hypothetical protein
LPSFNKCNVIQAEAESKKQIADLRDQLEEKSRIIASFANLHRDFEQLSQYVSNVRMT